MGFAKVKINTIGSLIVAAVAVALVVLLIVWRATSVEAVYPVERAVHGGSVALRERVRAIWRANAVVKENARLRREIAMLALVKADAERCELENMRLRRALEYVEKERGTWIAAEVIAGGSGAFGCGKTLRLGKGTQDGVAVGSVVASSDGLVGRVSEVSPHTSVVMLLTDDRVQVGCEVEGAKMRAVTAGGTTDGAIKVEHVTGGTAVPPRSRVVTSGLGGVFPKGIEIGVLVDGEILPSVDFGVLEDVFVRCGK